MSLIKPFTATTIRAVGRHIAGDAAAVVRALAGQRVPRGAAPLQDRSADAGARRQPPSPRLQLAQLADAAREPGVHHIDCHEGNW